MATVLIAPVKFRLAAALIFSVATVMAWVTSAVTSIFPSLAIAAFSSALVSASVPDTVLYCHLKMLPSLLSVFNLPFAISAPLCTLECIGGGSEGS